MKNTGYNIHVVVEKRPILLYSNNHFEDMLHVSVVTRYIHSKHLNFEDQGNVPTITSMIHEHIHSINENQ